MRLSGLELLAREKSLRTKSSTTTPPGRRFSSRLGARRHCSRMSKFTRTPGARRGCHGKRSVPCWAKSETSSPQSELSLSLYLTRPGEYTLFSKRLWNSRMMFTCNNAYQLAVVPAPTNDSTCTILKIWLLRQRFFHRMTVSPSDILTAMRFVKSPLASPRRKSPFSIIANGR